MKISELSAATDVPVGTIKYYLREGLLPPGERTSRTTARYQDAHVERIRLVRALTEAGGLGIAQVRRVLAVLDVDDASRLDVLATAQNALVEGEEPAAGPSSDRARDWVERRGWFSYDGDQVIERFARAWAACEVAGIDIDEAVMGAYADAVEAIARIDVESVPPGADDAVRRVVVGTVMIEPVLAALRLLAHRQLTVTAENAEGSGTCAES